MNTPPDGPGGERSPIASTVPDPNESLSAHNPAIENGASPMDPHAIVFFATDGIVSTRPLEGLARVRKKGDVADLGDCEYCEADSGLFVMPGVYNYGKIVCDQDGARTIKPVTKIRGGAPRK